ncbi:MAG: nSTAND1 domain-containing NTPase [Rhodanobacter sp.]
MHNLYRLQLEIARALPSDVETLTHLSSVLRSILQAAAICAIEIVRQAAPAADHSTELDRFVDRYAQPSDGLPIEVLDHLVPVIRGVVSRQYFPGWYEANEPGDAPLVTDLGEWVKFRNRRLGHGVVDAPTAAMWAGKTNALISRLLAIDTGVLPVSDKGALSVKVGDVEIRLSTPLVIDEHAAVISKIAPSKGVWKLHAQLLSLTHARELTIDLPPSNVFSTDGARPDKFRWSEVATPSGSRLVFHNVPGRQTSTFVGRKREMEKLVEWFGEIADYRTCLVFGDGGFGKTTLVLEFFNSLLEGATETTAPIPSVISYYTAKRTRWSEEGLIHIKGMSEAMEDSVRELIYCRGPVLGKEWYKINGRALIDKASAELKAEGLSRDDVLLIVDNTESLATSTADTEELADFLARVAKSIGRVVITSRRRELIAAFPVQVSKLSEAEALTLIQRLGAEYGAAAIQQSGDARLRRACEQLMYKPLLIDTLVRYIARSSSSVQEGLDQILKKTNDQLLEFLYEDAWQRMPMAVQEVFMALVLLATPLDGKSVGDVCREIGVQHAEFQASLGETYFGTIVDHGETYDLEIVELAKEFFRQKKRRLVSGEAERLENIATRVDKLATERFEIAKNYRRDRVADAFRSEFAKAAKVATFKKDYKGARELFELALQEEPLNAALRERYASFLFRTLGEPRTALPVAEAAVELDPANADAHLTLALIYYKLGHLRVGDKSIERAEKLGKPQSLCLLRRAIARYHIVAREPYAKTSRRYLREAEAAVGLCMRTASPKDFYYDKNRREAEKYRAMIRTLASKINKREVSASNAPEAT